MSKRIGIKVAISLGLAVIGKIVSTVFQPVLTNAVAVTQMETSTSSYTNFQFYKMATQYGWLLYVLIVLFIFRKEIKNIFANTKGEN